LPSRRTKKVSLDLPQSIEEVDSLVAHIGELQREVSAKQSAMNKQIEALKGHYGPQVDLLVQAINQDLEAIEAYAAVNRNHLTGDGKTKTIKLRSGTISWRNTPKSVTIRGVQQVIDRLKALGLTQYIRVKEEVDKNAILANPDKALAIEGVKLTQREEFVVVPSNSQAEVIKKGKVV
jgi:phage host-nuclease inhibitor protein Gam